MSKVFIVDDDPIYHRIAVIMIEKHKLFDECTNYTDASLTLQFLKENAGNPVALPDVILLDLNMPRYDGWYFLDHYEPLALAVQKDIKIYIVTSSVDEKDRLKAQSYSYVSGLISKPLSPDVIRNTMNFIS